MAVAALGAVGITALLPGTGGASAFLMVPILTLLLAVGLLWLMRQTVDRTRREAGGTATTDADTGVATVSVGERVLGLEFAAAQRGRPLTVVLIRLEGLPRYRARHGRAVADHLLRHAGRTLQRHSRGMHLAARHEGDEAAFLAILSGSDREGATVYAARVRRELMRLPGVPEPEGVSVGIASFDQSLESPGALLAKAALALNKGGEGGGKIVVMG